MDWQQFTSLTIVAAAAILLVRHEIMKRKRAKSRPCGQDCGCDSQPRSFTTERFDV